jgi:hypothetical protein
VAAVEGADVVVGGGAPGGAGVLDGGVTPLVDARSDEVWPTGTSPDCPATDTAAVSGREASPAVSVPAPAPVPATEAAPDVWVAGE